MPISLRTGPHADVVAIPLTRAATGGLAAGRILSGAALTPAAIGGGDPPTASRGARWGTADYFTVAATPRFRASQRDALRDSARQGMALVVGTAVLGCAWLVPTHPEALVLLVCLNVAVAVAAVTAYAAITTFARRHIEISVLGVVWMVDVATIALGWSQPGFGLVAAAYMLLLPTVVALVVPWATKVHVSWLALHGVTVAAYGWLAPPTSLGAGPRTDLLMLLVVATTVSLLGHGVALRARVRGFVQIARIRALNRRARRDEARLGRLNNILLETARTDELTGLSNRLSLKLDLVVARARIARHHERYGVILLDVDHFKVINDVLGHVAGDGVLQAIASALIASLRTEDRAYRYGGEEFVVLMRVGAAVEAVAAGERLRRAVENLRIPHPGNRPHGLVTISVGTAELGVEDLADDDAVCFARADRALYRAKARGRNRCESELGEAIGAATRG